MFCITITPFNGQGVRRRGLFFADLDGRQLCISRQSVRDAARILLAEGANPDDPIGIGHDGFVTMTATVGSAAEWSSPEGSRPILVATGVRVSPELVEF
jgi:hypothetical protein